MTPDTTAVVGVVDASGAVDELVGADADVVDGPKDVDDSPLVDVGAAVSLTAPATATRLGGAFDKPMTRARSAVAPTRPAATDAIIRRRRRCTFLRIPSRTAGSESTAVRSGWCSDIVNVTSVGRPTGTKGFAESGSSHSTTVDSAPARPPTPNRRRTEALRPTRLWLRGPLGVARVDGRVRPRDSRLTHDP